MGHLHLVLSGSCYWELGFLHHICRASHLSSHATNCRDGVYRLHSLATAGGRIHQEIGPPDLLPQTGAVSTKRSGRTVALDPTSIVILQVSTDREFGLVSISEHEKFSLASRLQATVRGQTSLEKDDVALSRINIAQALISADVPHMHSVGAI